MDEHHKELKFIASANTQIKFYNQQLPSNIFERLENFLQVLGIDIDQKHLAPRDRHATRKEIYFDNGWALAGKLHSLSIRSHDGSDFDGPGSDVLILRLNDKKDDPDGMEFLTRNEFRVMLEREAAEQIVKNGIRVEDLAAFFPQIDLRLKPRLRFARQGEVNIVRNWVLASVDLEKYYMYIDQFNFVSGDGSKHSEFYTEIDIERRFGGAQADGANNAFHKRIVQLARILRTAFDISADPTPKYQRFKEFCVSDGMEDFYFVGFDVVEYSNRRSHVQKHLSQQFHQIIKDEVAFSGFPGGNEPIKISIGDGAIIAVRMDWPSVAGLLERIRRAVARHNEKNAKNGDLIHDRSSNKQIEYRTGIHYGPVFRFTDLNGMTNLAGQGISMLSRVLDEADVDQILVSSQAYKRITDSWPVKPGAFSDLGRRATKHGQTLHLYEYLLG
jgi:class 3 adenylate cyclase